MVLWASVASLAASSAGLALLGAAPIIGELSSLGFAVSLFIAICAAEARSLGCDPRVLNVGNGRVQFRDARHSAGY